MPEKLIRHFGNNSRQKHQIHYAGKECHQICCMYTQFLVQTQSFWGCFLLESHIERTEINKTSEGSIYPGRGFMCCYLYLVPSCRIHIKCMWLELEVRKKLNCYYEWKMDVSGTYTFYIHFMEYHMFVEMSHDNSSLMLYCVNKCKISILKINVFHFLGYY